MRSDLLELSSVVRGGSSLLKVAELLLGSSFFVGVSECGLNLSFEGGIAPKDLVGLVFFILRFLISKVVPLNGFELGESVSF